MTRILNDGFEQRSPDYEKLVRSLSRKNQTKFTFIARFYVLGHIQRTRNILENRYFHGNGKCNDASLERLSKEFATVRDKPESLEHLRKWVTKDLRDSLLHQLTTSGDHKIGTRANSRTGDSPAKSGPQEPPPAGRPVAPGTPEAGLRQGASGA